MATALEALEKIGAAEADKAFAGAGEVVHHFGFLLRRGHIERGLEIVGEAVTRKMQHADGVNDLVGVEAAVLVVGIFVLDAKREGLRLALGEGNRAAAFQNEEAGFFLALGWAARGTFFWGGCRA